MDLMKQYKRLCDDYDTLLVYCHELQDKYDQLNRDYVSLLELHMEEDKKFFEKFMM